MSKVTINDVAKAANVSKTTVSHYLNERFTMMGDETKGRISAAIEELNYRPNAVAKSLKNKKTMTIGVIVANILHSFSTQMIRAIEDYAHGEKYHVIVCNSDNDPVKEKNYIQMLLAKQVDGMVVIPTWDNEDLFSKLAEDGYPLVFADRFIEKVGVPAFMLDNETAVKTAFHHLQGKGHRQIGFISQRVSEVAPRRERQNEYKALCSKHGLSQFVMSGELETLERDLDDAIMRNILPKSLIVANDLALFEVLKAVKTHGLSIPGDLSIISIDDIEFAEFFNPAITVVAQPSFKIGRMAAQTLFEMINEGYYKPGTHRFMPELIERESVKEHENE